MLQGRNVPGSKPLKQELEWGEPGGGCRGAAMGVGSTHGLKDSMKTGFSGSPATAGW